MAQQTTKERIFHVSEILFQQIIAVFVLLIIWELFEQGYSVTALHTWHIILCVIGFALCMTEGVQIFRKESVVTFGHTREDKKKAHLAVMLFGFTCITIGISLKIQDKTNNYRDHFTTTHAQLASSAWIISFIAALGGFCAYVFKGGLRISPMIVKICHIILGISAYLIGIAALIYGLENLVERRGWVALTIMLVIYVAYSLIGPLISLFNYILDK